MQADLDCHHGWKSERERRERRPILGSPRNRHGAAADKRIKAIVVDAEEDGGFRYNLSARLAKVLEADYFKIKDLRADVLLEIVRSGGR